jgi:GNAT superfamily N-acetyltransferase
MLNVRVMTAADVPLGMRLKEQAGWNQTEADWRRMLALEPDGCFIAERDGTPVGTTCTCIFGSVAWVAMVLVEAAHRGQGIGTLLMRHALAFLDGRGVHTVRLDATPLGQPIYEKLGFVAEYQLARYEGLPSGNGNPRLSVEFALRDDQAALLELDRAVTATDRSKLLVRLIDESPSAVRVVRLQGKVRGFLTARPGARATMIGPCIAAADAGPLLFADAWRRYAGKPVYIDVPLANTPAVQAAEAQGLAVQRHLLRMYRGEKVGERIEALWASSGPELG